MGARLRCIHVTLVANASTDYAVTGFRTCAKAGGTLQNSGQINSVDLESGEAQASFIGGIRDVFRRRQNFRGDGQLAEVDRLRFLFTEMIPA